LLLFDTCLDFYGFLFFEPNFVPFADKLVLDSWDTLFRLAHVDLLQSSLSNLQNLVQTPWAESLTKPLVRNRKDQVDLEKLTFGENITQTLLRENRQ
jgi:hypothetical protein